jgi:cytochrome c-type biogenesis protein CcmE
MDHAGEIKEPSGPKRGPTTWQRARGLVGLLAAVVAFYAVMSSMAGGGNAGTGASYFLDAAEARAKLSALDGKTVRLKGNVITGSYRNQAGTTDHTFDIEEKGEVIHVRYQGPLPDVFKEGVQVVAEGTLTGDGTLKATEVVAKCPSKYEEGKVSQQARDKMQGSY